MKGFIADIEELTEENSDFRRVLYTGKNLQLVLPSSALWRRLGVRRVPNLPPNPLLSRSRRRPR